jgi:integrase
MTYAKSMATLLERLEVPVPILRVYISGLNTQRLKEPRRVSPAIDPQSLALLLTRLSPKLQAGVLLAWKTASRWGDLQCLKKEHIVLASSRRIIIRWRELKTTRHDQSKQCLWTVVDDDDPMRMLPIVRRIQSLRPHQFIVDTTTAELDRILTELQVPWRAHSFKRGAVDHLFKAAAASPDDRIKKLIPRLAKHSDPLQDLPSVTIGYATDDTSIALALETQHVTRLL